MGFTEHKLWLLDDESSNFNGALIEMNAPMVSNAQWQIVLNEVLENFVKVESSISSINGMYAVHYTESFGSDYAGLMFSKLKTVSLGDTTTVFDMPDKTSGMLNISETTKYSKVATLALTAGFYSEIDPSPKPNRVLGAVIKNHELIVVRQHNVPPSTLELIRNTGKSMIAQLDSNMMLSGLN